MPYQTEVKKIVMYIIFSSWPWSSLLLIEIFFSPSRKVLNLRFCPVYITVTSSPSILEWAWHKRKVSSRIVGGLDLVSWTKLFFHVPKIYKNYTFCIFFNGDQWAAQRKTTWCCNFLFIFSDAFCLRLLQGWLQLTLNSIYSTFVSVSMTSSGSE